MKPQRTKQLNTKLTTSQLQHIQELNERFFDGKRNMSEMGAFLFEVAFDAIAKGKIEKKSVLLINGLPMTELK